MYVNTGSKGRFTNSAAGRSSPGSSKNPSSFKTGFGEIRAWEVTSCGCEPFPNETVWLRFYAALGKCWLWTAFDATRGWTTCSEKHCDGTLHKNGFPANLGIGTNLVGVSPVSYRKPYLVQSIASVWIRTRVGWLLGVSGCNDSCPRLRCVGYNSRPTNTFYDILWHVLLPNVFQAIVRFGTHLRGFKVA